MRGNFARAKWHTQFAQRLVVMTECMQDYGCNSVCGDDDLPTKRARNDVYSCTSQPSLLKAVGVCSSVALPRARAWTREKTIAQVGPCNSVPHPTKGTLPNNPQNLAACFVPYRKSTLFLCPTKNLPNICCNLPENSSLFRVTTRDGNGQPKFCFCLCLCFCFCFCFCF